MNKPKGPRSPDGVGKYNKNPREAITKPEMGRVNILRESTALEVSSSLESADQGPDKEKRVLLARKVIAIGTKIQELNSQKRKIPVEAQKQLLRMRAYVQKGYVNLSAEELRQATVLVKNLAEQLDKL